PDGEAMMRSYVAGIYPFDHLREVLFGTQDYIGDYHFNLLTPAALETLLKQAGFTDVELIAAGRPNGLCLEFELHARRGARSMRAARRRSRGDIHVLRPPAATAHTLPGGHRDYRNPMSEPGAKRRHL